jgi:hypothetical protein
MLRPPFSTLSTLALAHPKKLCTHRQTLVTASYGQKPSVSTQGHISLTSLLRRMLHLVLWYRVKGRN